MRISAISDVHVKTPHDAADKLLLQFLAHPLVLESDYVFLLGDIFDLMCGPHNQYLSNFSHLFSEMDRLMSQGKQLYFIEGNHDVHLKRLFLKQWPDGMLCPLQEPMTLEIEGLSYYFSHGDEFDVHNEAYHRYKRLILSPPLRAVANFIMPYSVLKFVGERASRISRKKGSRKFDEEKVREKFRQGLELLMKEGAPAFILGGHSHVKDKYVFNNGRSIYVNNGYALKSRTFISIIDHKVAYIDLA